MTKTNRELVIDNLLAFDRLAYREIADDYAEDAILRFMQKDPIQGRDNIREFFEREFEPITNTRIEILDIYEAGDTVIVERIDHYDYNGHSVSCPIANVTEVKDGQITEWREYFDQKFAADQVVASMKAARDAT
jgi:limonene-1,2-epoxide hydrolase